MEQLHKILENVFGYKSFRGDQEAVIQHTLAGNNALVIMPTGGGKSLCYQIPALVKGGLTLVVSPLISLMKDQVEALKANGVEAAALNSSNEPNEAQLIAQKIEQGILRLLYVSPEKAVSNGFLNFIARQRVSLIAIDEAHCVSVWGNDFRPEYARLINLLQRFPQAPKMALTATADAATRQDIVNQLQLPNAQLFLSSFERKNINIEVRPAYKRIQHIIDLIREQPKASGIVYCLSRKSTEQLAEKLQAQGFKAAFYHASIPPIERSRIQEAFQRDEIPIICATIAFGMGIDKSNVRWVAHYNMPKNVESYYQEIGRAGRDGLPSKAVMFAGFGDVVIFRNMIEDGTANIQFKQVQLQKLNRMYEFSQATNCRTNFILNYFGEIREKACGHCDNCKNPPRGFDGTIITQKALSALKRTNEKIGAGMLVDILRGSMRRDILDYGFHEIKTFGVGKDMSKPDWIEYITQMINQGFIEIDYTKNARLKISTLGVEILFGRKKVKLTQAKTWKKDEPTSKRKRSKKDEFNEELLAVLKETRKRIANAQNVVPTNIFSDASLAEMIKIRPLFKPDFRDVSGVGDFKFRQYGEEFLEEIRNFVFQQNILKSIKGITYLFTLQKYQEGNSPFQIAKERGVASDTIFGHLGYLYEKDEDIDMLRYVKMEEIEAIKPVYEKVKNEERPEVGIVTHFGANMARGKISLAISWLRKNEG